MLQALEQQQLSLPVAVAVYLPSMPSTLTNNLACTISTLIRVPTDNVHVYAVSKEDVFLVITNSESGIQAHKAEDSFPRNLADKLCRKLEEFGAKGTLLGVIAPAVLQRLQPLRLG